MAWMTQEAAARVLGLTPRAIRKRVGNGLLRSMRQGQQLLVEIDFQAARSRDPQASGEPAETPSVTVGASAAQMASVADQVAATTLTMGTRPRHASSLSSTAGFGVQPVALGETTSLPPVAFAQTLAPRIAGRQDAPQRSRSAAALVWIAAALLIGGSLLATRYYHEQQARMGEMETQRQDALQRLDQAGAAHRRALAALGRQSDDREAQWREQLAAERQRAERFASDLNKERVASAALQSTREAQEARIRRLTADRARVGRELIEAQTQAAGGRCVELAQRAAVALAEMRAGPTIRHAPSAVSLLDRVSPDVAVTERPLPRPMPDVAMDTIRSERLQPLISAKPQ